MTLDILSSQGLTWRVRKLTFWASCIVSPAAYCWVRLLHDQHWPVGSGCDSVGRAVASDTKGPRFESSHWQNLYWAFVYLSTINCIEKTKIKRGREWPIFLKETLAILVWDKETQTRWLIKLTPANKRRVI